MDVIISVIIPVYNVEKYLEECLDSLLAQTFTDYEVIAINDGSTDRSLSILNRYESLFSGRMDIITTENKGLSAARNVGIERAVGAYLYFFDSDDLISSDLLQDCLDCYEQFDIDLVMFDAMAFVDDCDYPMTKDQYTRGLPEGLYSGRTLFNAFIESNKYIVSACCYMYKLSSYKKLKFKEGILHEDNHFTTNLLIKENSQAFIIVKELFKRRFRESSIMTQPKTQQHADGFFTTCELIAIDMKKLKGDKSTYKNLVKYYQRLYLSATRIAYHVDHGAVSLNKRIHWAMNFNKFGLDVKGSIYILSKTLFYLPENLKSKLNKKWDSLSKFF